MKNYGWPEVLINLPLIVFFDFLSLIYGIVAERNLAPVRGRLAALGMFDAMWARRTAGSTVALMPTVPPWRLRTRGKRPVYASPPKDPPSLPPAE